MQTSDFVANPTHRFKSILAFTMHRYHSPFPVAHTTFTLTLLAVTSTAKNDDTPVVTPGDTNRPVQMVDTETPNIGASDEDEKMPFEDTPKIFVPIIFIFTVVSIALAIGFIIEAGKTASAIKYEDIFIGTWFEYLRCFCIKS